MPPGHASTEPVVSVQVEWTGAAGRASVTVNGMAAGAAEFVRCGAQLRLQVLYVRPCFRGRGLAHRMLQAAVAHAGCGFTAGER